nr:B151 [uncultured bacterium]
MALLIKAGQMTASDYVPIPPIYCLHPMGRPQKSYRASGLNLLVAAIILWNTRYLELALADMGTPDDIARHIAPLGWEHISLTGDYRWERDDRPAADQLRSLRTSPSLLVA